MRPALPALFSMALLFCPRPLIAAESGPPARCGGADTACLLGLLGSTADAIPESAWRDQTYRELAKLLAKTNRQDDAVALISKIQDPDTKAMTIRGIGMAAAGTHQSPETLGRLFSALKAEAEKIAHPPSRAIAYTYIAMSQAFAGDDGGAMATANGMENAALRNKAHNEAAKIEADRGDFDAALRSIAAIDDPAFRDKAHGTISNIFADDKKYDSSSAAADKIVNTYKRAQAILYLLARQISPGEVSTGSAAEGQ